MTGKKEGERLSPQGKLYDLVEGEEEPSRHHDRKGEEKDWTRAYLKKGCS